MRAAIRSSSHGSRRGAAVLLLVTMGLGLAGSPFPAGADGNEAPGSPVTFRSLSSGAFHTCAILDDGTVKCWGDNSAGQLGYGDTANRGDALGEMGDDLPTVDLGTARTATALAAGALHTCALLDNGTVKCWGDNSNGQLGYGDTADRGDGPGEMGDNLPTVALGTGRTATAIMGGNVQTCAILDTGALKCWGYGQLGELGSGSSIIRGDGPGEMGDSMPIVQLGTGRTATAVTIGDFHVCAILDNSNVKCWGASSNGQLGYGDTAVRGDGPGEMGDSLPIVNLGTGRTAIAVTAGEHHTCAVLDDNTVKCWGKSDAGQLGYGTTNDRGDGAGEMGNSLPTVDLGIGRTAGAISSGSVASNHTCVLLDTTAVKCWGDGAFGQLGYGDVNDRGDSGAEMGDSLPAVNLGAGHAVRAVTTGAYHTCALLDDYRVTCWGENSLGQLGIGDTTNRGDSPGEMGNELPRVDVGTGRSVVRMGITARSTRTRPRSWPARRSTTS